MIEYDPPILRGRTRPPTVIPVDYPLRYRELFDMWTELTVRIDNEIRRVKGATDMPITNLLDDVLARDCMIMAYHKVQQIMVELENK